MASFIMISKLILFYFIFLWQTWLTKAGPFNRNIFHHGRGHKVERYYCGNDLTEIMSEVCNSRFATPSPIYEKKSSNEILFNPSESGSEYDYYGNRETNSDVFLGSRFKRPIIEECCKRPCSLETLKQYCA